MQSDPFTIDETPSYAGRLLLAMPDMPDPNFRHSAIALCVHDSDGAMGIDLGASIAGLGLRTLMDNFGIDGSAVPDLPVLCGGPVEPRRGFVLHSLDWEGAQMVSIDGKWGLSGSLEILKAIANGTGPSRYIAALGYSGWSAGQLDAELAQPGWLICDGDADFIFSTPSDRLRLEAFARNGIDPSHLAVGSGHA